MNEFKPILFSLFILLFICSCSTAYNTNSSSEEVSYESETSSKTKVDTTIIDTKPNTTHDLNALDKSSVRDYSTGDEKVKSPGEGEYDDSGQGIFGRRIIEIPNLGSLLRGRLTGIIVVKMCVNPKGDVVFTELVKEETIITDKRMIKDALKVAKKYKYEKDRNAPELQCGIFIFKLDVE